MYVCNTCFDAKQLSLSHPPCLCLPGFGHVDDSCTQCEAKFFKATTANSVWGSGISPVDVG